LALLLTFTYFEALRESLGIEPSGAVGTIFSEITSVEETLNAQFLKAEALIALPDNVRVKPNCVIT